MQPSHKFSWLCVWLSLVLFLGLTYSFGVQSNSLLPGENLLAVGVGLILVAGVMGSARTGNWTTRDERVIPNRLEWLVGLTGAVLFACPFLHVLLLIFLEVLRGKIF